MTLSPQHDRLIHILLQETVGGLAPPDLTDRLVQRLFAPPRRRWRWMAPLAAAAAVLLAAGLWASLGLWSYPSPTASGDYRIESGALGRGATLSTDQGRAQVTLGGYCRLNIEPSSRVRLDGNRRAEGIYLEKGAAACRVDRDKGTFIVQTDVGTVSVTGTEFTVRILEDKAGSPMIPKKMIVKVLAGAVMLTGAWGSTALSAGQEKTFAAATSPKPLYGKVVSVDAASGNIVITATGGDKNGQQITVATDAGTKILVDNKAAGLEAIKSGMVIRVVPADGKATEIRAFTPKAAPAPPANQPKPLYGKLVSVDQATGNVVITAGTGTAAKQVTVATDANTKIIVNNKAGTLNDLTAGMTLRVVPATGTATEIRAFTPKS